MLGVFQASSNSMRTLILGRRQGSTISVILLERVGTVGQTGNIVDVKRGYARNFLIPRKLAGECSCFINFVTTMNIDNLLFRYYFLFVAYATTENKTKFANIIQNSASAKPETASA